MTEIKHLYEVRPRKYHRGVDLTSDALPFGRLWYDEPDAINNAVNYAKFFSRSHDAVIRVYDEAGNVLETHEQAGQFTELEELPDLWGERIDYSMHGSSCALDNAVPDILGCLRSALRHVGCRFDGPRLDSANGDGHRENDRKERFHGT
jgi:hypothetical protein